MSYITIDVFDGIVKKGNEINAKKTLETLKCEGGWEEFEYALDTTLNGKFTFSENSTSLQKYGQLFIDYNENIAGLELSESIDGLLQVVGFINGLDIIKMDIKSLKDSLIRSAIDFLVKDENWQSTSYQIFTINDDWQAISKATERKEHLKDLNMKTVFSLLDESTVGQIIQEEVNKLKSTTFIPTEFYKENINDIIISIYNIKVKDDEVKTLIDLLY